MLSSERKATLAPQLVQTLIRQEIDPVTEISTTVTASCVQESSARLNGLFGPLLPGFMPGTRFDSRRVRWGLVTSANSEALPAP